MLNRYDDKHFVAGMIIAYHTSDRRYNRRRFTRNYMRSRYNNPLAWDFVKETSTMHLAKVVLKANKEFTSIHWLCTWRECPPVGTVKEPSPEIEMCPVCDAPVMLKNEKFDCGFCGFVFLLEDIVQ